MLQNCFSGFNIDSLLGISIMFNKSLNLYFPAELQLNLSLDACQDSLAESIVCIWDQNQLIFRQQDECIGPLDVSIQIDSCFPCLTSHTLL